MWSSPLASAYIRECIGSFTPQDHPQVLADDLADTLSDHGGDRWYVPFQVRPLYMWKGEGAIGTVPEAGIRTQYRDYIAVVDKAVQGGTRATRVSERGSQGEATHAQLFSSNA